MTKQETRRQNLAIRRLRKAELDARQIEAGIGRAILGEIADKVHELCRCPFDGDGDLTDEGQKVAIDVVRELIGACGNDIFSCITEDILSTFRMEVGGLDDP